MPRNSEVYCFLNDISLPDLISARDKAANPCQYRRVVDASLRVAHNQIRSVLREGFRRVVQNGKALHVAVHTDIITV